MTDSFTFTDGRTGNTFDAPIEDGTVRATALRQAKVVGRRLRPDDATTRRS